MSYSLRTHEKTMVGSMEVKRLSLHRPTPEQLSVETTPDEEIYFSACESLDGQDGEL